MRSVASFVAIAVTALMLSASGRAAESNVPAAPRATVDVPSLTTGSPAGADPAKASRVVRVPAGGDLQKALDDAKAGDRIELAAGTTYAGPFKLKAKDGDGWTIITTAGAVPKAGRHVQPADAHAMARLESAGDFVIATEPGAHHYRFVGVEVAPKAGAFVTTLVQLGADETTAAATPHHIIIDRCYIHGDPKIGARRGVAVNGRDIAVVDSYLADFKEVGADSQAIAGWNGPGPIRIAGNYLEGAGENVMFGGSDPKIADLVPSDIEIVHNHFSKPLRWKKGDPSFEGIEWSVKNLFELKNARRVLVDGNLLEYNWPQAQNGFSILFTVRNQDGAAPWSTIEDVAFTNNLVRHIAAGVNMLGRDDNHPSQQAQRILIRNNLFVDVGGAWGPGRLFQMLDGMSGVTIDHNTAFETGGILFGGDHAPHTAFVFQNNVVTMSENGVTGSGTGEGNDSLRRYFPNAVFRRNVIVGGMAGRYPPDNFFPSSLEDAGVAVPRDGDLRVTVGHTFSRAATDSRDPGVDIGPLTRALGDLGAQAGRGGSQARTTLDVMVLGSWPADAVMFWGSLALLLYIYAGYPVIAAIRARCWPKPRLRAAIEPRVSIVVIAHNEADRIGSRIKNLLALDYPRDRMEIVVGSDGSTDATVARARAYEPFGITVHDFAERRGKPATVNAVVPLVNGDIVVFADARQQFETGALRALVANFADPQVGAASGELVIAAAAGTAAAGHGASFYWRYEKFIRSAEGRGDSTVGATGAIYAIRRVLFERVPDDTLLDDVLIPLRIVRAGYRVVFEPDARAHDAASATAKQEFVRKTRTIAGMFQLLARETWLLNPFRNRLWFETVSHKVMRLALPTLHAALLLSTLALADTGVFGFMLVAQLAFYMCAIVGSLQRGGGRRSILFSAPCAMCLLLWATVVGFFRFLTHRQQVTWERVAAPAHRDVAA